MSKENENSESKKNTTKKSTTKKNNTTNTASKKDTVKKSTNTKSNTKDTKKNLEEKKTKKTKVIEEKATIKETEDFDNNFDYDEDLEEGYGDDFEEIVEEVKPTKKTKEKKEVSKENIKKIEKIAKEKNKSKKHNNSKIKTFGYFLEEHRNIISSFIAGIIITTLVAFIIWPDRIATLKNGTQPIVKAGGKTYTANDLYDQMKEHYSVNQLLDSIDNDLLTKLYPEDEEMTKEVESNAEYYINMYKQYYNYTEEQFLSANGFATRNDYLEYLKLDYRRKKYQDKYIEENLTDKDIQKYYDENVYGDINCQHILVEVASEDNSSSDDDSNKDSNKLSDEDAKKLAQEIIDKINDGTSWKDIQKEYKDKVTYEDLGYQTWDSDLEDSFKKALKDMDNKSYSDEPVKTSYGYHVIYRIDQKKAPSLKKTKDKIIENLIAEKTKEDSNIMYKALINLRKEKKIKFSDTDMKDKYDKYIKEYSK